MQESETLIVEAWLSNFPWLATAYHLKETFSDIYEAPTEEIALQRSFAWFAGIPLDTYEAFWPLTLAIAHDGDALFNSFTYRSTAGCQRLRNPAPE